MAWRFIFPGVAAVQIFIAFPVAYKIYLGVTNHSSFNLLTYARSVEVLTSQSSIDAGSERQFIVATDDAGYRIWFPEERLLSDPIALDGTAETATLAPEDAPANLLLPRDAITLRSGLQAVELVAPNGTALRNSRLRAFALVIPEYRTDRPDWFIRTSDVELLTADHLTGFFMTEGEEQVPPGWRTNIGLGNYQRIFASEGIRAPMFSIFLWTVTIAFLSVALTFAIGLALAVILQWPHLRGKPVCRILLILPYMMLFAMAFLQGVPEDHRRAAALEGASALRVFFTITLPQIIPPFLLLMIASFAINFNNIALVLLMTRGGPDILGTKVPAEEADIPGSFTYRIAFMDTGTQFDLAGATTFLIFVVVGAIACANFAAMRRAVSRRRYGA